MKLPEEIACEVAVEVSKDIYRDALKPTVQTVGEIVNLLPRAIKVALTPVEKWILHKEYSLNETEKLLAEKLKNVPPENIVPPESYIAVPALEYISYCMDNDVLRNLYADLLASAMNAETKNYAHPSFVEIIKQLSPDEAKFLRYINEHQFTPIINVIMIFGGIDLGAAPIISDFTNVFFDKCDCTIPKNCSAYIDNLVRLGLLERSYLKQVSDKSKYTDLENHDALKNIRSEEPFNSDEVCKLRFERGLARITAYGINFCKSCLPNQT